MVICDYLDKNVKNYLKDKSNRTIITFFKEPFNTYRGNEIIFIDDVLNKDDYKKIDEFVNRFIKVAEDVFSIYLKIDEYCLFNYLKLNARVNLSKMYKYKYTIDKIANIENKTITIRYIYSFSSETELLEWLKQDYKVQDKNNYRVKGKNQYKLKYKLRIKKYLRNSFFANYIFDKVIIRLFKDYENKSGNILWMGGRSYNSKLISELTKDNKMFLLPQFSGGKLSFIKGRYKFDLLELKNNKKFNEKWDYFKDRYEKGLNKIAFITGISIKLLEIILKIDKSVIKDLLLTLFILEDNKDTIDLLLVEQSVNDKQALAVDFFNKNELISIEIPHGVIGVVEVGKTDKIVLYGQRDKLFLSSYGVDKSKMQITGCPYYDRIFCIKKEEKKYDFLLLILGWIHFLSSSTSYKKIFMEVVFMLKLVQHFQSEKLVIKLHPGQSKKEMEYIYYLCSNMKEIKNRVEVKKDQDVIELLKKAKIVYTTCSSVGVEALLIKKPLIVLDFFTRRRPFEYERYNGCFVAKNYKDLVVSTEEILRDVHGYLEKNKENIERTREYFSGDLKGESYKNVANLIKEMLHK